MEKLQKIIIQVPELDCSHETDAIKKVLSGREGIISLNFYTISREVRLVIDTGIIKPADIIRLIKNLGMTPLLKGKNKNRQLAGTKNYIVATVFSGIFILAAVILKVFFYNISLSLWFFGAAIFSGWYLILRRAFYSIRSLNLDMNVLMSVAICGALILGEWGEASTVVFLFSLAQLLEHHSMEKTCRSIRGLMKNAPDVAIVKKNGKMEEVPSSTVETGDIIYIKAGSKIPLDGIVVTGESTVNQAPVTGESAPVIKKAGDVVFAGTINQNGALEVRVTHRVGDSELARIISMVEDAQTKKAPAQSFVDAFSRYYTPAVVLIASLITIIPVFFFRADFQVMFYRSLVLLLIACPCALVISTPVSIVSGITSAARNGVLIKGGLHLEKLASIDTIAIDKTGTLTYGKPVVSDIKGLNGKDSIEVLKIASAVESMSTHPIARAITEKANEMNVKTLAIENFRNVAGLGVEGKINENVYFIGSHRHFCNSRLCNGSVHDLITELEAKGRTVAVLGDNKSITGVIVIEDAVRKEAGRAIKEIKKIGAGHVVMITGDNEETARTIAENLDVEYISELLPGDKVKAIEELKAKGRKVAMVGDGINDAPALAAADAGIAMGAAGSDTALEVADIALMSDDLEKIPYTLRLAGKTMEIIKQNIILSIGIKAVFLILGLAGVATLWMAVFADMGASLLVIFNGLRLLKFK